MNGGVTVKCKELVREMGAGVSVFCAVLSL
jgi:hypothetical protein